MCPGLTSPGADLPEDCLPSDTPVSYTFSYAFGNTIYI